MDRDTYAEQRDELREAITLADMEHRQAVEQVRDCEGILSFAEHTLPHASTLWTAAAGIDERIRLRWSLFHRDSPGRWKRSRMDG